MPKATLIFQLRLLLDDGAIMEMRIWRVAAPVPPSTHGFKYSLFYGRPGERIVLFDNERGKGDHQHLGDAETPYNFTSPDDLIADFLSAVDMARRTGR